MIAVQHEDDLPLWQVIHPNSIYIGNLKEMVSPDNFTIAIDDNKLSALKNAIGTRPIWLAAMLHKGEEHIITNAHHIIKQQYPNIITLVLLRHHDTLSTVQQAIGNAKHRTRQELPNAQDEFYIIDSYGETDLFYALCDIICIMGSFGDVGGHNPLPAARHGAVLLCGDDMKNAQSIYDKLARENLITYCDDSKILAHNVINYLNNPVETQQKIEQIKNYTKNFNKNTMSKILDKLEF